MSNDLKSTFTHLHIRTGYSFYQSTIHVMPLLARAGELKLSALAITDAGNLTGAMDCYLRGREQGIKGIVGTTVSVKDRSGTFSLILLCENLLGYRNLCRIVSSNTITKDTLIRHNAGLIVLSGGVYGGINRLCRQGEDEAAESLADWLSHTFPERFFIELHPALTDAQQAFNNGLRHLAAKLDIPTVATAPCHYLRKEDRPALEALRHLGKLPPLSEAFPGGDAYWLMSPEEIGAAFADDPASLVQTGKIAALCQLELESASETYAIPPSKSGNDPDEELRQVAMAGLELKTVITETYRQRLEHELTVIREKGFSPWFLLAADVMTMARNAGIQLGAGRGACPSSLVSYSLGLSELNPIEHKLIFERFLNTARNSFPDIFIDIPNNRHSELIKLIVARYGHDKVAMLARYRCLGGKSLIRRLGIYLGIEEEKIRGLIRLRPEYSFVNWIFVSDLLEAKEAREMIAADEKLTRLMEMAKCLNALPCRASSLKNEILITSSPPEEYLPVRKTGRLPCTHYYVGMVRSVGLTTLPIQGFDSLSVIDRLSRQKNINLQQLTVGDEATWQLIVSGDTKGVFELGSPGIRKILRRAQPASLAELAAIVSLHRPGPIEDGLLEAYIQAKGGKAREVALAEPLRDILGETRGIIVYQEQIIEIVHRLAGYAYGDADEFRRQMLRRITELNDKLRGDFLTAAEQYGTPRGIAETCFELMIDSSPNTFLKSHAISWALNSYRAAYLKAHFPEEFEESMN